MDDLKQHIRFRIRQRRILRFGNSLKRFIPKGLQPSIARLVKKGLAVMRPSFHIRTRLRPSTVFPIPNKHLTVLSANLWHDWPLGRKLPHRLEAFARLVEAENADVVLLQEVVRTADLFAGEWLADRLGMAYAYSRANGDESAIGFEEGLAILSRHPILCPSTKHLGAGSAVTRRLALASEVKSPHGDLLAISVHLGFMGKRNRAQMADLFNWVRDISRGRPTLIGGDFNAHETAEQISLAQQSWIDTFRMKNPEADGTTFEFRWPWGNPIFRKRFDYIFLQPGFNQWDILDSRHVKAEENHHSDHSTVVTRLKPPK